jgi:hypothetical protein
MRRPQNYGYEPVPQNQTDDLEIENERLEADLSNKISSLKSLTIDIGELLSENCWLVTLILVFHFRKRSSISR